MRVPATVVNAVTILSETQHVPFWFAAEYALDSFLLELDTGGAEPALRVELEHLKNLILEKRAKHVLHLMGAEDRSVHWIRFARKRHFQNHPLWGYYLELQAAIQGKPIPQDSLSQQESPAILAMRRAFEESERKKESDRALMEQP